MKIRNLIFTVFLILALTISMLALPSEGKVVLKETLRLEDGGGGQFFKSPRRIWEIPGRWIYLLDNSRLLRFSPEGTGLGEMVPRGEGPGELTRVSRMAVLDDLLAIVSGFPFKVVLTKPDGDLHREFRPEDQGSFYTLLHAWKDRLILSRLHRSAVVGAGDGLTTIPLGLYRLGMDGKAESLGEQMSEILHTRRLKLDNGRMAMAANSVCRLKTALDSDGHLYMAYTPRYSIKVFDLETGKIVRMLKRTHIPKSYSPPSATETEDEVNSNRPEPYQPETFNDILGLSYVLNELWVVTSDFNRETGFRVDRFSGNGKFLGALRLKIPGVDHPDHYSRRVLEFTANRLWVNRSDADGNPVPVRYHISPPHG